MEKRLTFKDVVGKDFTLYTVTRGGSIRKSIVKATAKIDANMNSSTLHLNLNGTINNGWGYACFLNADEAANVATRIATTKYNNSIEKIKKVTNT